MMDGSLNRYYHQFDIYLGCHAILAVTNKYIYGYILRNIGNHQLEGLICSLRTVKLVTARNLKWNLDTEMELILSAATAAYINAHRSKSVPTGANSLLGANIPVGGRDRQTVNNEHNEKVSCIDSGSQLGVILPPRGHWATHGDICGCRKLGGDTGI